MHRASILLVVTLLLPFSLLAQPIASLYDMHIQYGQVEMIQLAPGVVVRADIWPDDYVPTVQDFLVLGVPYQDAVRICTHQDTKRVTRDCTWGELKICFAGGCIRRCCPENCPDKNEG